MSAELDYLREDPVNPVRQKVDNFLDHRDFEEISIAPYDEVKDIVSRAVEKEDGEIITLDPEELGPAPWGAFGLDDFSHMMPGMDIADESERYDIAHFLLSGNAINFYFHGDEGVAVNKYTQEGENKEFLGAEAMFTGLLEAREKYGEPLDGYFWKQRTEEEIRDILDLENGLEMIDERVEILENLGNGLTENYDGSFLNLIDQAENSPYTEDEDGVVNLTRQAMPEVFGSDKFAKKNQLNTGILYSRCRARDVDWFDLDDMDRLTAFADYMIPVKLNEMGLIQAPNHTGAIDQGTEEEYRFATLEQVDRVAEAIKELYDERVDPFVLDSFFWANGRALHMDDEQNYSRHQFETTNY